MLKRDVMYPAIVTKEDGVYYVGLVDFDRKTTGLKKSSLIILAARPRYG